MGRTVTIRCPDCRKDVTISAGAHEDAFVCFFCGRKLSREQRKAASKSRKLTLRKGSESEPGVSSAEEEKASTPSQPSAEDVRYKAEKDKRDSEGRLARMSGWIVLILLAPAMGAMRYGGFIPDQYIQYSREYAWLVVLAFHFIITIRAFTDSVFGGILCLLVPAYSLYYLLVVSDEFVFRGIVVAVLVGVGQDSAVSFQEKILQLCAFVNHWIMTQGG